MFYNACQRTILKFFIKFKYGVITLAYTVHALIFQFNKVIINANKIF